MRRTVAEKGDGEQADVPTSDFTFRQLLRSIIERLYSTSLLATAMISRGMAFRIRPFERDCQLQRLGLSPLLPHGDRFR